MSQVIIRDAQSTDIDTIANFILALADYEKLAEIIPDEISRIDGITKTSTVLAFRRFSPNDLEAAWSVGIE
jgi:DNA-binding Lrp family transcriptional regulator